MPNLKQNYENILMRRERWKDLSNSKFRLLKRQQCSDDSIQADPSSQFVLAVQNVVIIGFLAILLKKTSRKWAERELYK